MAKRHWRLALSLTASVLALGLSNTSVQAAEDKSFGDMLNDLHRGVNKAQKEVDRMRDSANDFFNRDDRGDRDRDRYDRDDRRDRGDRDRDRWDRDDRKDRGDRDRDRWDRDDRRDRDREDRWANNRRYGEDEYEPDENEPDENEPDENEYGDEWTMHFEIILYPEPQLDVVLLAHGHHRYSHHWTDHC